MRDLRADASHAKEGGGAPLRARPLRLPIRVWVPFPAAYPLNEGLEHLPDFPPARG